MSDVYKQNFKKIVKLMVDDVWKTKKAKALAQYQAGNAVDNGKSTGIKLPEKYDGMKYADQEKRRLNKIVHGKMTDSIVGHRSSAYNQRMRTTDLTQLTESLPWTKTKVIGINPVKYLQKQAFR